MYIIVRSDLPPGLQLAQVAHAAFAFSHEHPDLMTPWLLKSNYLIICSVPDEPDLLDLITAAHIRGIVRVAVREPDCDDQVTACALAPGPSARTLCASLPLALRQVAMT